MTVAPIDTQSLPTPITNNCFVPFIPVGLIHSMGLCFFSRDVFLHLIGQVPTWRAPWQRGHSLDQIGCPIPHPLALLIHRGIVQGTPLSSLRPRRSREEWKTSLLRQTSLC